jgi:hypothetical protein
MKKMSDDSLRSTFEALIGLTTSQAEGYLSVLLDAKKPLKWNDIPIFLVRPTSKNGESFPVTCDFSTGRLNVDVDDEDRILGVYSVG